jgi:oligopeptide/dipeptide ABC transporter ATP-binding protein
MLKGDVPSAFNPPPGCKFQGRCPLVESRCREGEIAFYPVGSEHFVRCWKVVQMGWEKETVLNRMSQLWD